MTWVYLFGAIMLGHLIGLGIGSIKQDGRKHELECFLLGYGIVNIAIIIYLITNTWKN